MSTPEYICRLGFAPSEIPDRTLCRDSGGAHSHARGTRFVVSHIIMETQAAKMKELQRQSQRSKLDFFITNNMFDETKLFVGGFGRGRKRQCVLAASGQITWKTNDSHVIHDQDVIRAPAVLKQYTAATCRRVVAAPDDPAGIVPVAGEHRPLARFMGSLMATDQHSVNVLLSKWAVAEQRRQEEEEAAADVAQASVDARFHLATYCIQHKTGSAVERVTQFLGLISPAFCIASSLSWGNLADDLDALLLQTIEEDLICTPDPPALSASDARQVRFVQLLLDECFVNDVQRDTDRAADVQRRGIEQRQAHAQELLAFFSGPWSGPMVHVCRGGCCPGGRPDSVQKAFALLKAVVAPPISTPAVNKYTKVDPVVRKVTLMVHCFGLLRRIVAKKLGVAAPRESEVTETASGLDGGFELDGIIGIPKDPRLHQKCVGEARLRRVHEFMSMGAAKILTLVWLVVCSVIMQVHYRLFKHGTWFTHRAGVRCSVFEFAGRSTSSPVIATLSALASMLLDPLCGGRPYLQILRSRYGDDMADWPPRLVRALEVALVLAFATLWRKIYRYFDCYPWRLAPAFDPQLARTDRETVVREFLGASECCLDPGLGLPLRKFTARIEDYLEPADTPPTVSDLADGDAAHDPTLRLFLQTLFERSVVTSTQVELQFAGLSLWTTANLRGPRLNLPGLAARAVATSFGDAVSRWRALPWIRDSVPPRQSGRSRPAWTKTNNPGHKTTHLHLFAKQVKLDMIAAGEWPMPGVSKGQLSARLTAEASRRFALLSEGDQARWKAIARTKRDAARFRPAPIDLIEFPDAAGLCPDGPFGLSSRAGKFPMRPEVVQERLDAQRFADRVSAWGSQFSTRVGADADFPDSVPAARVCVGSCRGSADDDIVAAAPALVSYLRKVLRFFGTHTKGDGCDPTTVVKFRSPAHTVYFLVAHAQQQNSTLFEAELLRMEPALAHLGDENCIPILLGLCPGPVVGGTRWPEIQDELECATALLALHSDWELSIMSNRPALLGQRWVTAETVVSVADVAAREATHLQQAAAVRAWKRLTQAQRPKAKRAPGARRKPAGKTAASSLVGTVAASSSDYIPAASGLPGVEPPGSDADSSSAPTSSESDADLKDCWRTVMLSLTKTKPKARARPDGATDEAHAEGLRAPDVLPAEVPAIPVAGPPLVRGPRLVQAPRGSRVVEDCGARISAVMGHGRLIGFGIVCGRHNNASDKPGTRCKRQVLLGEGPTAMSHQEAKLRLKRWYVSGHASEATWPAATKRTAHVKFGGLSLALLASDAAGWCDMSEAELDDACRIVPGHA